MTALGSHLPADAQEMNRLLEAAIQGRDDAGFSNLLFAALGAGHAIDARHLIKGISLLRQGDQLISAAWYLQGDVAGALLEAVKAGGLFYDQQATALMMAGIWCKCKRHVPIYPEIIARGRIVARHMHDGLSSTLDLAVLAFISQDQQLSSLLESMGKIVLKQNANTTTETVVETVLAQHRHSPVAFIPEDGDPYADTGQTIRHETPIVGRNDPCPCGSGKKYKKCCLEKEPKPTPQLPSITELQAKVSPPIDEIRLTREHLWGLKARELMQLDATKISPVLLPHYLRALLDKFEVEAAAQVLEQCGRFEDWEDWWDEVLFSATQARNSTLVRRLMELRQEPGFDLEKIDTGARLILASESPNPALDLINTQALKGLRNSDYNALIGLGYALLEGSYSALGIMFTRGLMNTANEFDAYSLLDAMFTARDKLNLDAEEPASQVVDDRFLADDGGTHQESPELEQTRQELQENNEQMRRLRQKLVELEKEVERKARLKSSAPIPSAPATTPQSKPPEDTLLQTMRKELESLKSEIKDRHFERNQLRRELQKTVGDLAVLKQQSESAAPAPASESKDETELFVELDAATENSQGVHLPEFPKRFYDQLAILPKSVVRHALTLIGRMAAGEPAAFHGMKRLSTHRDVCRQRVGADHRLLFRLNTQTLEIIALINRRDLERTVRNLL